MHAKTALLLNLMPHSAPKRKATEKKNKFNYFPLRNLMEFIATCSAVLNCSGEGGVTRRLVFFISFIIKKPSGNPAIIQQKGRGRRSWN